MRRTLTHPMPRPTSSASSAAAESGKWLPGDPVVTAPSCSASAPAKRSVTCVGVTTGAVLGDDRCTSAGSKPSQNVTIPDYRTCTYTPIYGVWTPYSSTCASGVTRDRDNSCQRDLDAQRVDPVQFCKIAANDHEVADVYSGCPGVWKTSYGSCRADDTVPVSVSCVDGNGAALSDDRCNPSTRPVVRTTMCTGVWASSPSACMAGGSQTPTVTCQATANGATIPDSACNPSKRPASIPASCAGTWGIVAGACTSSGTQTITPVCYVNGSAAQDSFCDPSIKPSSSPRTCAYAYFSEDFEGSPAFAAINGRASFSASPLAHGGAKVARLATGSDTPNRSDIISSQITLKAGTRYNLSLWARGESTASSMSVLIYVYGVGYVVSGDQPITSSWTRYTYSFTPSSTNVAVRLLSSSLTSPTILIDDVTVTTP